MRTRFHLGRVQGRAGAFRHWGGHAGLMLQAEIGRHTHPNTRTGDEGDRSQQTFPLTNSST